MSTLLGILPSSDTKTFSERRIEAFQISLSSGSEGEFDFLFPIYSIELLRQINRGVVTPIHAYAHARMYHNALQSDCADAWNKYLQLYRFEIESMTAAQIVSMIYDLGMAILTCPPQVTSAGLPIDLYNLVKRCDKKFVGFVKYPTYETLELSLKHMDITETDKSTREHVFTMSEIQEMFGEFLAECVRPVRDDKDLMDRTAKTAISYYTVGLAIIYRLFFKGSDQYWYLWDLVYKNRYKRREDMGQFVSTVPLRTPEFVIGLTGRERFSRKSLEAPVEIHGIVDRYLYLLKEHM